MKLSQILASTAFVAAASLAGVSAQAASLGIQYFEIPNPNSSADFRADPGNTEIVAMGSALGTDGLPVAAMGSVADQNGSGEILWWSTSSPNPSVTSTGSGLFTLGALTDMYAPNNTGGDDSTLFETAILSGTLTGTGADATITVGSDDDTLVYVDGLYVGGNLGVHGTEFTTINLGDLTGPTSLEIFYADRDRVGADLSVSVAGASVPEPGAWALMLAGFAGLGATLRRRRSALAV